MKKKIWDLYAPIYERAMRADANIYEFMYARNNECDQLSELAMEQSILSQMASLGCLYK